MIEDVGFLIIESARQEDQNKPDTSDSESYRYGDLHQKTGRYTKKATAFQIRQLVDNSSVIKFSNV